MRRQSGLSAFSKYSLADKLPLLATLSLSTLLSVALVAVRIECSGHVTYLFLVWNLFLAWTPLFSALVFWWFSQYERRSLLLLLGFFGGWLLFFPNSPYIVTDFLHLEPRQNVPTWYDLLLIFSFAWNGLILGFISLWIVQSVVEKLLGRVASWLMALCTLTASGFGIYLGRFLRWNSWDVLTDPYGLAIDIYTRLSNPLSHPRVLVVTLLFSAFLTIAYLIFTLSTRVHWVASEP